MSTRRTVLLVEDNAANAELAAVLLSLEGWYVNRAESGPKALELLAVYRPDVVLLDLMLPGMDGVTLLREVAGKPALSGVPVVVLTAASGDAQDEARAAYPGVTVLQKPAEPAAIVAALSRAAWVARKGGAG